MKIIGYARVVPGESGESALDHQKQRLESYCETLGLPLSECLFEEIGGDTSFSDRPRLVDALKTCQPGDTLLVVRLDRLSSQKKLLNEIFQHCAGRTISIKAVAGPQSPDEMKNSLEVTVQAG